MNDFFRLADQIPIPMAIASVITATIVASFLVVLVGRLEPTSTQNSDSCFFYGTEWMGYGIAGTKII